MSAEPTRSDTVLHFWLLRLGQCQACRRGLRALEQVGTYRSLLVFRRTAAAKNRDDASFALQP